MQLYIILKHIFTSYVCTYIIFLNIPYFMFVLYVSIGYILLYNYIFYCIIIFLHPYTRIHTSLFVLCLVHAHILYRYIYTYILCRYTILIYFIIYYSCIQTFPIFRYILYISISVHCIQAQIYVFKYYQAYMGVHKYMGICILKDIFYTALSIF